MTQRDTADHRLLPWRRPDDAAGLLLMLLMMPGVVVVDADADRATGDATDDACCC